MSTPPLVALPSSSCIASVIMSLTRVVGLTESPYTLEEQSFKWPGERWSIDFRLANITNRGTASDWMAFGAKLQGKYGRFLIGDPAARMPRGVATGVPVVNGGGATGNTLPTKGWTPSTNGILLKGDYIQLGTGVNSRLHMLTENINSDAGGNANLSVEPALRTSPADNSPIITNNPVGLFRMSENTFAWSVDPGMVYRFSFQAVEVLGA